MSSSPIESSIQAIYSGIDRGYSSIPTINPIARAREWAEKHAPTKNEFTPAGRTRGMPALYRRNSGIVNFLDRKPIPKGAIAGSLAGLAAAYLPSLLKKELPTARRALLSTALGGLAGGSAGALWKVLSPTNIPEDKLEVLAGPPYLSREAWHDVYKKRVNNESAVKYLETFPDDPNHPANVMFEAVERHYKRPDVFVPRFGNIPRSWMPLQKEHGTYEGRMKDRVPGSLSEQDLYDLGGFVSYAAVPERGQNRLATWRFKDHNVHFHDHGDDWVFHEENYPSAQVMQHYLRERGYNTEDPVTALRMAFFGAPHAIFEGGSGWAKWLRDKALDGPTLRHYAEGDGRGSLPTYNRRWSKTAPGIAAVPASTLLAIMLLRKGLGIEDGGTLDSILDVGEAIA